MIQLQNLRLLLVVVVLLALATLGKTAVPVARAAGPNLAFSVGRLIFNDVINGGASDARSVTISNTGTSNLVITSIALVGGVPFAVGAPALPATLAPGNNVAVSITFNPTTAGPQGDILRVQSNAANTPQADLALRGLGTNGLGGSNEPSLQWVLDTYQIPVSVGDDDPATSTFATSPFLWGDEIAAQRFRKAGVGNVTIEPIAVFGPSSTPVTQVGWYPTGNPGGAQQLFEVPKASAQTLNVTYAGGTSFDPADASFGIYSFWPTFSHASYSEDALNTWENSVPTKRHKLRVYPLKETGGALVPNAYVVATEETNGLDSQDIVVIVRNVAPIAPDLVLDFDRAYPGTFYDKDGQTLGFVTTQRNKNDALRTNNSYAPDKLDITIAGQGTLAIDTTPSSSAGSTNTLVNGLLLPFDATSRPFSASARLLGPFTAITQDTQQGGVMFGPSQDTFVKLIAAQLPGVSGKVLEFYKEENGVGQRLKAVPLPDVATIQTLDLQLSGDPATGVVRASYRIVTTSGDTGLITLVEQFNVSAALRSSFFSAQGRAGLTVSGRDQTTVARFSFDRFAITSASDTTPTETATATSTVGPGTPTVTAAPTDNATPTGTLPTATSSETATPSPTAGGAPNPTSTPAGPSRVLLPLVVAR